MTPLKTSTPTKEDQETNSSLDSPAPEKVGQRLNLALASPSSSETPKATPLLIPFEAPCGSPLEPHPLSSLFPAMKDAEFAELVEDLKRNGLLMSIVVYEGKILEGRNRNRGCIEAEVTPHYVEYIGSDPLEFIVSVNLHRRHLTTAQRAMIASKLATMKWGGDRTSEEQRLNLALAPSEAASPALTEITLKQAANRLQVSRASAVKAKAIAKAAPDVAAQVEAGKLSLDEAAEKAGVKKASGKPKAASASPVAQQAEALRVKCAEHLEAIRTEFPGFTVLEIAKACVTAAKHFIDGKYSPPERATAAK
jgi:hypothetical protein